MADEKALNIIRRHEQLVSARMNWMQHWQDLKDLVRPSTSEFSSSFKVKGRRTNLNIFDGTAVWANEQLAAGLHSFLTNPTERWFTMKIEGQDERTSAEVLAWLETVSDIIYKEYADPDVNFNPTIHELYLDLGSFGTGIFYQDYNRRRGHIIFKTFALGDCSIAENSDGFVDTLSREITMTRRQMEQMFGNSLPKMTESETKKVQDDRLHDIIHLTFPRSDRDHNKLTSNNMPFASIWVWKDKKIIIRDSGFNQFPYHTPRWTKLAGEVYGRSPGMTCLPDIKMVNQMVKTVIKGAQKMVDPPLMVPDDGFVLPLKTAPGSMMFYDASLLDHNSLLRPLETKGQPQLGLEMINQVREQIVRCFFLDFLSRPKKKERQTTTEILDDREETLRQLAPIIGRAQSELLGPVIRRSYNLLNQAGRIPPAPQEFGQNQLSIDYVSQAFIAQLGTKAIGIQRFIQDLIPLVQITPDIMDTIDSDAYAIEMARLRNVSRKVLNSPEKIAQIRDQRKQQQAAAAQAEQAAKLAGASKSAAGAIKELSVARKNEAA